jgi:nucleoid protein MC1
MTDIHFAREPRTPNQVLLMLQLLRKYTVEQKINISVDDIQGPSKPYLLLHRGNARYKNMSNKRNFALRDKNGEEIGVFSGKQPRQAALKAANRGYTDIRLRERGTKKVHIFKGERNEVDKPANAPDWMPDKIWKPNVEKIGIEKLDKI